MCKVGKRRKLSPVWLTRQPRQITNIRNIAEKLIPAQWRRIILHTLRLTWYVRLYLCLYVHGYAYAACSMAYLYFNFAPVRYTIIVRRCKFVTNCLRPFSYSRRSLEKGIFINFARKPMIGLFKSHRDFTRLTSPVVMERPGRKLNFSTFQYFFSHFVHTITRWVQVLSQNQYVLLLETIFYTFNIIKRSKPASKS